MDDTTIRSAIGGEVATPSAAASFTLERVLDFALKPSGSTPDSSAPSPPAGTSESVGRGMSLSQESHVGVVPGGTSPQELALRAVLTAYEIGVVRSSFVRGSPFSPFEIVRAYFNALLDIYNLPDDLVGRDARTHPCTHTHIFMHTEPSHTHMDFNKEGVAERE